MDDPVTDSAAARRSRPRRLVARVALAALAALLGVAVLELALRAVAPVRFADTAGAAASAPDLRVRLR